MTAIGIPLFIKNMGHRILSFILNIDEISAQKLINGQFNLDPNRSRTLSEFIEICRQLRMHSIDQGDVDFSVFHSLPHIVKEERHIFNVWHEQLGGQKYRLTIQDPVVLAASKIALEIYPLFLIKLPANNHFFRNTFSHLSSIIYRLSDRKILIDGIMNDPSMSKLFTSIGQNEMDTFCQYKASTGRSSSIQLAVFPDTLIANAYELMRIRGKVSQTALIESVEATVQMLRDIGEGKQIDVPVFVGFHNVGLDDLSEMEIEWGKIRAYSQEIIDLIPDEARPATLGGENKFLGFILESKYPYKINLGSESDHNCFPPELKQARKNLEEAEENLSFTLALAVDRTPPISIIQAWTLVFDPLSQGTSISWKYRATSPMPHYLLKDSQKELISYWSKKISDSNDEKIRIAIRRILSSINDRQNPIDGFVDTTRVLPI